MRTSSPPFVGRRDRYVDLGLLSAGVPGALSAIIVERPSAIGTCGAKRRLCDGAQAGRRKQTET
jgi:hypothetical protein